MCKAQNILYRMYRALKIIFSILILGLFLVPVEVSACTSHSNPKTIKKEKSCCDHSDHQSKQACKKDCCKDKEGDSGCSGNCDARSCHTTAQTFCVHPIVGYSNNVFEYEDKNSYPSYKQPCYSSGFHSIWQPPKIG